MEKKLLKHEQIVNYLQNGSQQGKLTEPERSTIFREHKNIVRTHLDAFHKNSADQYLDTVYKLLKSGKMSHNNEINMNLLRHVLRGRLPEHSFGDSKEPNNVTNFDWDIDSWPLPEWFEPEECDPPVKVVNGLHEPEERYWNEHLDNLASSQSLVIPNGNLIDWGSSGIMYPGGLKRAFISLGGATGHEYYHHPNEFELSNGAYNEASAHLFRKWVFPSNFFRFEDNNSLSFNRFLKVSIKLRTSRYSQGRPDYHYHFNDAVSRYPLNNTSIENLFGYARILGTITLALYYDNDVDNPTITSRNFIYASKDINTSDDQFAPEIHIYDNENNSYNNELTPYIDGYIRVNPNARSIGIGLTISVQAYSHGTGNDKSSTFAGIQFREKRAHQLEPLFQYDSLNGPLWVQSIRIDDGIMQQKVFGG